MLIFSLSLAFNDIRNTLVFVTILSCIFTFVFLSVDSLNYVLKRMYVVIPFIIFALLLPFISIGGPQIGTFVSFAIYKNGLFELFVATRPAICAISVRRYAFIDFAIFENFS